MAALAYRPPTEPRLDAKYKGLADQAAPPGAHYMIRPYGLATPGSDRRDGDHRHMS